MIEKRIENLKELKKTTINSEEGYRVVKITLIDNELQFLEQLKEYIKDNEFAYTIGEFQSEIIIKTCDLLGEQKESNDE